MAPTSFAITIPRSLIFHLWLALCLALCFLFSSHSATQLSADSDREALLSLKSRVSQDPFGTLSQWNDSSHFCNWVGVLCSRRHGRVIAIDLEAQNLVNK